MGLFSWLRGEVRLALRCRWPERALNLAAREGVAFRHLLLTEEGAELTVSKRGEAALRAMAERTSLCTLTVLSRRGAPYFFADLRHRYALFMGLALTLGLLALSQFRIWQIQVYGNETVPTEEILAVLRDNGITVGASVFSANRRVLANALCIRIPKLSWATVNVRGSRAWVLVRELRPAPPIIDWAEPKNLIARRTGTIVAQTVLQGRPLFQVGDSVLAGETLIDGEGRRAFGTVTARTHYTLRACLPLSCALKVYTGEEGRENTLLLGNRRIKISIMGGNPGPFCDRIATEEWLTLPGGDLLPLGLRSETLRDYETVPGTLPAEEAEALLRAQLTRRLAALLAGSVERESFSTLEADGLLTVTLTASCLEDIAIE